MFNIIILTSGRNMPLNVKLFSYLLEKNKIPYKIISQGKNIYVTNKYIFKKKGFLFFLKIKFGAILKLIINHFQYTQNENNSKIYNFFNISKNTIEKYPSTENISYADNLNNYLRKNKFDNTLFLSFGAPIIKKDSINHINNCGNNIILNSHIGTSNYPGITPYLWALYKKDYQNIGFILHQLTDKIDKGNIYLEKNKILEIIKDNIGVINLNQLTTFLLLYSSQQIYKYIISKKAINEFKPEKNTYNSNIKTYFLPSYFETIIAEKNLKNYFN